MALRGCGMEHTGPCISEMEQSGHFLRVSEDSPIKTVIVNMPGGPITLLTFNTDTQVPTYAVGVSTMRALSLGLALIEAARQRLETVIAPSRDEKEVQAYVGPDEWEEATGDDADDGPQSEFNVDRTGWRGI